MPGDVAPVDEPLDSSPVERVTVLVVGGSLVGLSAAVFLADAGVDVLVVEQRPSTSTHPKARLVTARSMELFRSVGLEPAVRAVSEPGPIGFVVAGRLTDDRYHPTGDQDDETLAISPSGMRLCDQQLLEPLLLTRARELGADVRLGWRLVEFADTDKGARAVLVPSGDGGAAVDNDVESMLTVECDYLLAADGIRSSVREQLNIGRSGHGSLGRSVSAIFEADLEPALHGRSPMAVILTADSAFLFARGTESHRSWQIGFPVEDGVDPDADQLAESARAVVRSASGLPDLDVDVRSAMAWESAALVADRFRAGAVFLLGDAAHAMPPSGGFGGNTGVQDAHNLAWKISLVTRGVAGPDLLDTYDRERRPVALATIAQTRGTPGRGFPAGRAAVQLGYRYPLPGEPAPAADNSAFVDPFGPGGCPGTRAPHLDLGQGRSVLDLFGAGFMLLTADSATDWESAAGPALQGVPYSVVRLPTGVVREQFADRYGVGPTGAVLIRPDGFVAWRAVESGSTAQQDLSDAVQVLLG